MNLGLAEAEDRFGAGARSAPRDALIASSVDEEHRGRAFGLEGFGDNAGAFLGPLLTVFLLYSLQLGPRAIFYLAIIPGLLALFMVLPATERPAVVASKSTIDMNLRQFPRAYWTYLLVTALFGLGNSSNSFLILRTQEIGASLEKTILIYAAFNLVAALISYPAGSLSDSWGRKRILLAAFTISLIVYLGFAVAQNIGGSLLRPSLSSLLSKRTTTGQGATLGLQASYDSLGRIAGSLWAGAIFDVGMDFPYWSGIVIVLICFALSVLRLGRLEPRPAEANEPLAPPRCMVWQPAFSSLQTLSDERYN